MMDSIQPKVSGFNLYESPKTDVLLFKAQHTILSSSSTLTAGDFGESVDYSDNNFFE